MKNLFKTHSLIVYFVLAFCLTWGICAPLVILHMNWQRAPLLAVAAAFGPTLAAVISTFFGCDKGSVGQLLRRYLRWRVGLPVYLLAFIPLLVSALVALIYTALGGAKPVPAPHLPLPVLLGMVLPILLVGPISEEAGWRGFALARLLVRYGAVKGSLLLGVIWWFWHLPVWFVGSEAGSLLNFGFFMFHILGLTLVLTLVYSLSGGSLMLTVLGHFSANFGSTVGSLWVPKEAFYRWGALGWLVVGLFLMPWLSSRASRMEAREEVRTS